MRWKKLSVLDVGFPLILRNNSWSNMEICIITEINGCSFSRTEIRLPDFIWKIIKFDIGSKFFATYAETSQVLILIIRTTVCMEYQASNRSLRSASFEQRYIVYSITFLSASGSPCGSSGCSLLLTFNGMLALTAFGATGPYNLASHLEETSIPFLFTCN